MYREWLPPPDLREDLVCVWSRQSATRGEVMRILPDACMDLVWVDGDLEVAGPDTTAWLSPRPPCGRIVGLRFRPGRAASVLGLDAAEHTDQRVDVEALWGRNGARVREQLAATAHASTATALLLGVVRERLEHAPPSDPAVTAVAHASAYTDAPPVHALADELGLSERQLRRRSREAFGYGPKVLARVLRFQRFLRLATGTPPGRLAVAAAEAGYADQAHLTRDTRQLAGLPPAALLADRRA
jgi:AraC-like DNA-binding protein